MIIQEQELERLVHCPLMTPTSPSPVETCAYALASWVLRKSFLGKFSGTAAQILHEIRGKGLELYPGDKTYAGAIVRTSAFRLFGLVTDYEVLHLEQPYNVVLSEYTIQGKYALLRKRNGYHHPYVLVLHTSEPEIRHHQALPPDAITLARFVHVLTTTQYTDAQVLHCAVLRGKHWFNKTLNVPLAKSYLEGMIKASVIQPQHPIMGDHCTSCVKKSCLEVFHG